MQIYLNFYLIIALVTIVAVLVDYFIDNDKVHKFIWADFSIMAIIVFFFRFVTVIWIADMGFQLLY